MKNPNVKIILELIMTKNVTNFIQSQVILLLKNFKNKPMIPNPMAINYSNLLLKIMGKINKSVKIVIIALALKRYMIPTITKYL